MADGLSLIANHLRPGCAAISDVRYAIGDALLPIQPTKHSPLVLDVVIHRLRPVLVAEA